MMIITLLGAAVLGVTELTPLPAVSAGALEYPFIPVYLPELPRNHNARAHEDAADIRAATDTPLCTPPDTPDIGDTPSHWQEWPDGDDTLPHSPHDVWIDPSDWDKMDNWWQISLAEAARAEHFLLEGRPYRFQYEKFEGLGGKYGLVLDRTRIKSQYRNHVWDVARWYQSGPPGRRDRLRPVPSYVNPRDRCTWDLDVMIEESRRRGYPDMGLVSELSRFGLDNRARVGGATVLCPNYKGLYEPARFEFMVQQFEKKRDGFKMERLLGPFRHPPCIPCMVVPTNVAERPFDTKKRVTRDFGGNRKLNVDGSPTFIPAKAGDPSPISVNAAQDQSNEACFPDIDYLRVRDIARQAAILREARSGITDTSVLAKLRIRQFKSDFTGYYEQIPRCFSCDWMQVQVAVSAGGYIDPRLCFGDAGCCNEANRCSFWFIWAFEQRLRDAQAAMEAAGDFPPEILPWMQARRQAGNSGNWFTSGIFFDDSIGYCFEFFHATARRIFVQLFKDFGVECADGGPDDFGVLRKDKTEWAVEEDHMIVLGSLPDWNTCHVRASPELLERTAATLTLIQEQRQQHGNHRNLVPENLVERFLGQLGHVCHSVVTLVGTLQVLRESLGKASWASQPSDNHANMQLRVRPVSTTSFELMQHSLEHAGSETGSSFFPRTGLLGKAGRGLLYIWTDASGAIDCSKEEHALLASQNRAFTTEYRGWGMMAYLPAAGTVYLSQDLIPFMVRKVLEDSTAAEMFAANEAYALMLPVIAATGVDVIQLVDNDASRSIMETGKAHGAAERLLYEQRCRILDQSPPASVCVPVWISRARNWETDDLSKHLYISVEGISLRGARGANGRARLGPDWPPTASAEQYADLVEHIRQRFAGATVNSIVWLAPKRGRRDRWIPVLRARERVLARRKRQRPP